MVLRIQVALNAGQLLLLLVWVLLEQRLLHAVEVLGLLYTWDASSYHTTTTFIHCPSSLVVSLIVGMTHVLTLQRMVT